MNWVRDVADRNGGEPKDKRWQVASKEEELDLQKYFWHEPSPQNTHLTDENKRFFLAEGLGSLSGLGWGRKNVSQQWPTKTLGINKVSILASADPEKGRLQVN